MINPASLGETKCGAWRTQNSCFADFLGVRAAFPIHARLLGNARLKRDVPVWCVFPILKKFLIFCQYWEEQKYVPQMKTACSRRKRTLIATVREHNIHHLAEPLFYWCSATNRGWVSNVLCTVHYLQITFLVLNFTKRTFFQSLKGNIDSPLLMKANAVSYALQFWNGYFLFITHSLEFVCCNFHKGMSFPCTEIWAQKWKSFRTALVKHCNTVETR